MIVRQLYMTIPNLVRLDNKSYLSQIDMISQTLKFIMQLTFPYFKCCLYIHNHNKFHIQHPIWQFNHIRYIRHIHTISSIFSYIMSWVNFQYSNNILLQYITWPMSNFSFFPNYPISPNPSWTLIFNCCPNQN